MVLGKQAVLPYEPLINFANREITEKNWEATLDKLKDGLNGSRRLDLKLPLRFEGEKIVGPKPLQKVQDELRWELNRLVAPSGEKERQRNLGRLLLNLNSLSMTATFQFSLFSENLENWAEGRVLSTDEILLVLGVGDLRHLAYCLLGLLWTDKLLLRIGRCQNHKCRQFFIAKTRKKTNFCSQRCGQSYTAADRVKQSRVRRATWESVQDDLEHALQKQNQQRLENTLKKAEQAFAEAYPRQKGAGYEDGKKLLARAKRQISRLRKRVKGH